MGVTYNNRIVTDGLVLCLDAASKRSYPGTGTVWTDLKGGNNGTLTNMDAANFSSDNGGNLSFDGSNEFIGFGNILSGPTALSIFCSAKIYSVADCALISKGIGSVGNREYSFQVIGSNITAVVADESAQDIDWFYGNSTLVSNKWYHLAMTWDGSELKMYVDSVYDGGGATSVNSGDIEFRNDPLVIGRDNNVYGNSIISNVSIYNRALTADEILQNYLSTKERYA